MLRTRDSRIGVLWMLTLGLSAGYVQGCGDGDGGLPAGSGGSIATGGRSAVGGAANHGGAGTSGGSAGHAGDVAQGGTPVEGGSAGAAGHDMGDGGTSAGGTSGAGEGGGPTGGTAGAGTGGTQARCVYYTPSQQLMEDPIGGSSSTGGEGPGSSGGADGAGIGGASGGAGTVGGAGGVGGVGGDGGVGGAPPRPTIITAKNAFAGVYLTDGAGKALYTYGADAPGDCESAPVTNCYADCAIAWPPFNGEPRLLGEGLDDSLFGSIPRTDGPPQTTYRGWPLYYYKNDLAPGDVKGQAVGRIWALAQVVLPNVTVLRLKGLPKDLDKTIADGDGYVLYAFADDTKGTATSAPVSACTGDCLTSFEPFSLKYLSPVTYLAPRDFTYFVRPDGVPQLAYKGAPLYLSYADEHPAQLNGTASTGFAIVPP